MSVVLPPLQSRITWVPPLLLVLAVFAVYGRLIWGDFTSLDDPFNLYMNPRMNPPTFQTIVYYWTNAESGLYIPVTYTIWAIIAAMARTTPNAAGISLNAGAFHLASIIGHTISTLAAFWILLRLIGSVRAAFIGALLFALHPLQVEAVGWASGLKDVLAGMFGLLATWQYIRFAQGGARSSYALATAAFVLAMLSKPSAMMVPLIVLMIDRVLLKRDWSKTIESLALWAGLSIACALVARIAQDVPGIPPVPLWARPMIALDSLTFYLWKMIWPMRLAVDYGHRPEVIMTQWWFWFTWLVPLLIAAIMWINRPRADGILAGSLIFVAATLPMLGLAAFQFQFASTTSDHYVYLAMLGPALAVAWLINRSGSASPAIAMVAIIGLFAIRSSFQVRLWTSDVALFENAVAVNPTSRMARNNLSNAYRAANRHADAELQFRRVVELYPDSPEAHGNLAFTLEARHAFSEAAEYRRRALDAIAQQPPRNRSDALPHLLALGFDLENLQRYDDADAVLAQAMALRPNDRGIRIAIERIKQRRPAPSGSSTQQSSVAPPATTQQ